MKLPGLVVHCDWGASPAKRWAARAVLRHDHFHIKGPEAVPPTADLLSDIRRATASGTVLVGFDFPIGLPLVYARRAGITRFLDALGRFGTGEWSRFYDVADSPEEITIWRPFYPWSAGARGLKRLQHLMERLDLEHDDLWRVCERRRDGRRAASPLFWTVGAQQVGKGAIVGWREVLAPAVSAMADVAIWPFAGPLADLLERPGLVIAETYPAEAGLGLGLRFQRPQSAESGGKRSQRARQAQAPTLLAWAAAASVALSPETEQSLRDGFGASANGEDAFDAVVGIFGMLDVVLGRRPPGEVRDQAIRAVEGWILGQDDPTQHISQSP